MKLLKRQLRGITKEDIESEYSKLTQQGISKTILDTAQNELLSLLGNDNIMHKELLNLSPLVGQLNYSKFYKCLEVRDAYLQKNKKLSSKDFVTLFGNTNTKIKSSLGKYNKANLQQGGIGECGLLSGLEVLKKTPFFETMIRCSLKRTEYGRKCLLPFCNQQEIYEEITDEEIDYLKVPNVIKGRSIISNSSLGFNILETLIIKNTLRNKNISFEKINDISYEQISNLNLRWDVYDMNNVIGRDKSLVTNISTNGTSKEGLLYLLKLSKTGIIKLCCQLKIPNNYQYNDTPTQTVESTRGYKVHIYKENDDFSYGIDEVGHECFKPQGCDEWFITNHEYSIEKFSDDENYVVLKNPWFTEKKLKIPLKQFQSMCQVFDVISFNIKNLFTEDNNDNKK